MNSSQSPFYGHQQWYFPPPPPQMQWAGNAIPSGLSRQAYEGPIMHMPYYSGEEPMHGGPPVPAEPSGQLPQPLQGPSRTPLEESTGAVLNSNGKRSRAKTGRGGAKRARGGRTAASTQTNTDFPVVGSSAPPGTAVGPSVSRAENTSGTPPPPQPLRNFGSLIRKQYSHDSSQAAASDVWNFMYALEEMPVKGVTPRPDSGQERMRAKPQTKFVACRLCTDDWRVWRCQNGQTDTIRAHLRTHHADRWRKEVIGNQLKGWEQHVALQETDRVLASASTPTEIYSNHGLSRRVVRWIAGDDQAINVVESPLFRDMLIFASTSPIPLTDKDILHRTHAHDLLVREYEREMEKLRRELQMSLGRISFTCDLWTCKILRGYFATTVHWSKRDHLGHLTIDSRLGAFRNVLGQHTGKNLAEEFFNILEELGITHKLGCITLDNASNNNTMMADLERILTAKGIPFHRDGNRLRCFPHVVNIAVQHGLSALTDLDTAEAPAMLGASSEGEPHTATAIPAPDPTIVVLDENIGDADTNGALEADLAYADALRNDPIKNARQLISVCRVSGQRREEFKNTISEGNRSGSFGEGVELPKAQLLRDVDTRWSSTFLMIDRLLELYPAVQNFMKKPDYEDLAYHLLSEKELDVLADIRGFLLIPHRVQELLSADQTPTASMVLPAYEELLDLLRLAHSKYPKIAHAIEASITVLEQYLRYTRQTRVYALAMVLNPSVKLKWLEKNWTTEEVEAAKAWIHEAMLDYRKREREDACSVAPASGLSSTPPPGNNLRSATAATSPQAQSGSRPSRALRAGFESLQDLRRELSSSSVNTVPEGSDHGVEIALTSLPPNESDEDRDARMHTEDKAAVDLELEQYIEEGLRSQDVDLLTYWDAHSEAFPYLFRVALDILPVPASSVASERAFSLLGRVP